MKKYFVIYSDQVLKLEIYIQNLCDKNIDLGYLRRNNEFRSNRYLSEYLVFFKGLKISESFYQINKIKKIIL